MKNFKIGIKRNFNVFQLCNPEPVLRSPQPSDSGGTITALGRKHSWQTCTILVFTG